MSRSRLRGVSAKCYVIVVQLPISELFCNFAQCPFRVLTMLFGCISQAEKASLVSVHLGL